MEELAGEKDVLTKQLIQSISETLKDYAEKNPRSKLQVEDVREVMTKIIDYMDIADITGFNPWEN